MQPGAGAAQFILDGRRLRAFNGPGIGPKGPIGLPPKGGPIGGPPPGAGPAVNAATPGWRVTFAHPSAANAAADSWRTSTMSIPSARQPS